MINIFHTAKQKFTYPEFVHHIETLLAQGQTTGSNQSEEYLFFAKLNLQRIHRLDKTFQLRADIKEKIATLTPQPQHWWVITEGWCGDSAQCLPILAKMAQASEGKIRLNIVLRDDNPTIMDQYLTNGKSKSIPILAAFHATETEKGEGNEQEQLFKWGPRPQLAQVLFDNWRNDPNPVPFEEFEKQVHTWYAHNKGNALQDEMMQLL